MEPIKKLLRLLEKKIQKKFTRKNVIMVSKTLRYNEKKNFSTGTDNVSFFFFLI